MMQNQPDPRQQPSRPSIRVDKNIANPYQERLPSAGEKIGPNRIEGLIGEGGAANVYKVWHEGLEVVRAVKVLKTPGIKEARDRFLTEAKILADINHPNIVQIYNIGYYDQQMPFIEMEFIDGSSVKNLIAANGRLPLPVSLAIAYFVSQALQYAHTKDYTLYGTVYHGLIHRDIKPDNIVIARNGQVKLMDFGIARPSEVSLHTVGAKIMGTLVYLSPEQLNGTALDHRSDIFSLGSVLYEMIAGVRAYPQKTLSDLVQHKTRGQHAPVEAHGVPVPKELVAVINKSMALNQADRYETTADFTAALFSVFRGISDRAPQEVVTRYVKNPSSVVPLRHTRRSAETMTIAALGAAVAGLLITLLVILLR